MFRERKERSIPFVSTWPAITISQEAKASKDIPIRRNFAASNLEENEENGHRLVESKSKAAFRLVYRMLRHIRETVVVWLIKENTDEYPTTHTLRPFFISTLSPSLFIFFFIFFFFFLFYFPLSSPFSRPFLTSVFRRQLRSSKTKTHPYRQSFFYWEKCASPIRVDKGTRQIGFTTVSNSLFYFHYE